MSHVSDIREICGDYAIDVKYSDDQQFTLFFNSRRNAQTVKRCIEVDDSIPNVATAVDFVEVVRCKDCRFSEHRYDDVFDCKCPNTPFADDEYALALLRENDAEIERLKSENEYLEKVEQAFNDCVDQIQKDQTEVKYLKHVIRAEAITEFAEMLCEGRVDNDPVVIAVEVAVKEMREDQNNG